MQPWLDDQNILCLKAKYILMIQTLYDKVDV